jgi:hypothetical protein
VLCFQDYQDSTPGNRRIYLSCHFGVGNSGVGNSSVGNFGVGNSGTNFGLLFKKWHMPGTRNICIILILMTISVLQACEIGGDDIVNPVDSRAKFIGDWKVYEDCTRGNYMAEIILDPGNSTQVLIENFGNPGPGYDPAVGLVVSNSIKVSSQNIGEGWTVSGQGTYQQDGSIQWTYTLIISGFKEECTAAYTR